MAFFGSTSYVRQPGWKYQVAQDGIATYDVTYKGTGSLFILQGSYSEDYSNCILMSFSISSEDCQNLITLHYEGYDAAQTSSQVRETSTMDITASQEPIETHPDFLDFAGVPTKSINDDGEAIYKGDHGAMFNPDGSFKFFIHNWPDDTHLNEFAGIQSYLFPREVFTVNRVESNWPSSSEMALLGHIISPSALTSNTPPSTPSGLNWLYSGIRVENIGNVYFRTQRTCMLSGPRGWNTTIY